MKKQMFASAALSLAAFWSAGALAQAKPETLAAQRHAAMELQGKYLYSLLPMAQGKAPYDARIVARNVEYLGVLTQMPWDGFTPETANVPNTRALPEIYKDPAAFKQKIDANRAQYDKLVATVKTGNEAAIKEGLVEYNRSCNSCHDQFRAKR